MTQKIQELTRQIIDLKENAGSGSADFACVTKEVQSYYMSL